MKTTTTFLTVLFLSLLASTNAKASQLYLRTTSGAYTSANISGSMYFSNNGEIRAFDLRPGTHFITVTQKVGNRGGRRSYREANHRGVDRVIYKGRIFIPNRSTVYARITPRGLLVIERTISQRPPKQNHKVDHRRDTRPPQRKTPQRDYRKRGDFNNEASFNAALNLVESASFESEKLSIAKQYVSNNDLYCDQVLQMANAFDFESSKLTFTKLAYKSTLDPENYFLVNETFDFSSSVLALAKYIE